MSSKAYDEWTEAMSSQDSTVVTQWRQHLSGFAESFSATVESPRGLAEVALVGRYEVTLTIRRRSLAHYGPEVTASDIAAALAALLAKQGRYLVQAYRDAEDDPTSLDGGDNTSGGHSG
ncbi:hypothetical protein FB566_0857 [Stackebrandtia endophytica]|uniref:YbaB/EbfC DNA-binding family protein n=1 Tax=Stackebrandtia endophytica TaxID=1496996 RepID=A0A543AS00_9ACTN|nr:hypothetical protein [Stackebrandtia endophytica]TQL75359.1 hypothetical protein FB566_0857 [Stackebrandtia endophytica]